MQKLLLVSSDKHIMALVVKAGINTSNIHAKKEHTKEQKHLIRWLISF
ncbi:MAG: hypothetical protein AB8V05_07165 [Francisella endosymbiont of Hyalomma scupense]